MIRIDAQRTALLVMDYQAAIVPRLGSKGPALVERTAGLLAAARKAKLAVLYVVVGFRAGYPEVSPNNASFSALASSGGMVLRTPPEVEVVPELAPEASEPVIVKRRVGAFTGTELELILRAKRIDTLLLAGISTSGVVLSTVRHAADADYRLVVVADCCADADDEVHRVLTEKVFIRQASVAPASEVIAALGEPDAASPA